MCLSSTKKWCLSGTPIRNYGDDMYAQYKFLGYEEYEFNVNDFYKLNLSKYIFYINYDKANIKLPEMYNDISNILKIVPDDWNVIFLGGSVGFENQCDMHAVLSTQSESINAETNITLPNCNNGTK
jgi:hypothetical protein